VPVDGDEPHRAARGRKPADAGGERVNGWFPGLWGRADGSTLGPGGRQGPSARDAGRGGQRHQALLQRAPASPCP
jgi:hypothetical protein